ncbi:Cullin-4A [Zancudomyces culisetae]|uniref:Cullin-4A n=1 Tax=Zancudomyces culisetae TaxID=1213189 RepID=A0A1R1PV30_ZANCU|nr:Cullin-4A [Zancudomyces culisetae]|eukprot:OMH84801.1 Cullin-4A [Zancudomyces culisetae]
MDWSQRGQKLEIKIIQQEVFEAATLTAGYEQEILQHLVTVVKTILGQKSEQLQQKKQSSQLKSSRPPQQQVGQGEMMQVEEIGLVERDVEMVDETGAPEAILDRRFEEIYRECEIICKRDRGVELYTQVVDEIRKYIEKQVSNAEVALFARPETLHAGGEDTQQLQVLKQIAGLYLDFKTKVAKIICMFLYLDKTINIEAEENNGGDLGGGSGGIWGKAMQILKARLYKVGDGKLVDRLIDELLRAISQQRKQVQQQEEELEKENKDGAGQIEKQQEHEVKVDTSKKKNLYKEREINQVVELFVEMNDFERGAKIESRIIRQSEEYYIEYGEKMIAQLVELEPVSQTKPQQVKTTIPSKSIEKYLNKVESKIRQEQERVEEWYYRQSKHTKNTGEFGGGQEGRKEKYYRERIERLVMNGMVKAQAGKIVQSGMRGLLESVKQATPERTGGEIQLKPGLQPEALIKRVYKTMKCVAKQQEFNKGVLEYILTRGKEIIIEGSVVPTATIDASGSNRQEEIRIIQELMEMNERLSRVYRISFESEEKMGHVIAEGFETIINMQGDKIAYYMAKYLDEKLRIKPANSRESSKGEEGNGDVKSSKKKEDGAGYLDAEFDKVIKLFRMLNNKQKFEEYYKINMARRLINGRSASREDERLMLHKMRTECGADYTNKLEGMLRDIVLSNQLYEQFCIKFKDTRQNQRVKTTRNKQKEEQKIVDKSSKLPLLLDSILVLTSNFWPSHITANNNSNSNSNNNNNNNNNNSKSVYKQNTLTNNTNVDYKYPSSISAQLDQFRSFYVDHVHSGRKLTFLSNFGTATISTTFEKYGKREFVVSHLMASILVQFTTKKNKELSALQICKNLDTSDKNDNDFQARLSMVNSALDILANGKIKLLATILVNDDGSSDHPVYCFNQNCLDQLFAENTSQPHLVNQFRFKIPPFLPFASSNQQGLPFLSIHSEPRKRQKLSNPITNPLLLAEKSDSSQPQQHNQNSQSQSQPHPPGSIYSLDAAIVRVLKQFRKLSFSSLLDLVSQSVSHSLSTSTSTSTSNSSTFNHLVDFQLFKSRLDSLIDRDYVARCESSTNVNVNDTEFEYVT